MFDRISRLSTTAKNFYRNGLSIKTQKVMRIAAGVVQGGVIILESVAVGFIHFANRPIKPYLSLLAFLNVSPITNTFIAEGSLQRVLQTVNCGVTSTATMLSLLENKNSSWDVVKSTLDYQTFFKVIENIFKYQQNDFTMIDFFDCGIVAVKNLFLKNIFSQASWQSNKFLEAPEDAELHFLIVFSWVFLMLDLVWSAGRALQVTIKEPVMDTLLNPHLQQEELDELNTMKQSVDDELCVLMRRIHS